MNDAAFIFGVLSLIALALLYLMFTHEQAIVGVAAGGIDFVLWGVIAGWWLDMQTNIPGVAFFFYGLSIVCLIFLMYGGFQMMRARRSNEVAG